MLRLVFLLALFSLSCGLFSDPEVHSVSLSATVLDSVSLEPIVGAVVTLRDYSVPDSIYFPGDSVDTNNFPSSQKTGAYGRISIFFSQGRVAGRYQPLFAYKERYRLWRFDKDPIEIKQPWESGDEATIFLVPK